MSRKPDRLICEKFFQTQKSRGAFILGSSLCLLQPNKSISNKHMFKNFKILLRFTKTKLDSVLQQKIIIYQLRNCIKDWVSFYSVIIHYGNFVI